jgi:cytochrome b6-f complex iron-sulfur subunit
LSGIGKGQMETREPDKEGQSRRGRRWVSLLLGGGILGSIASFIYPAIRYIIPPPVPESTTNSVTAARVGELKLNTGEVFKFGSEPAILILTAEGDYRAFAAVCTHLACTVQYRPDLQEIWCPCHNGVYDLNGRNVSGPPPRPLQAFKVHVQGDDIIVTRSA